MQRKALPSILGALIFGLLLFPAEAQDTASPPSPSITAKDVFAHLARTIAWYQHVSAIDPSTPTADNFLLRNNTHEFAKRTMQSSFAFARAQAAFLGKTPTSDTTSPASGSTVQQSLNKADARVTHLEDRLQSLDSRIAQATATQRDTLVAERTAIAADLTLAKQMQTALKTMSAFGTPKSSGGGGLLDQISMLEAVNPINDSPADKDKPQAAAPPDLTIFHPESAGIVVLASKAFSANSTRKRLDLVRDETDKLIQSVDNLRAPLRTSVRVIVAQSDSISNSEDSSIQLSEWLNTGKQISELSGRFKQLSTVLIPLGETSMSLQSARGTLDEWRANLDAEYNSAVRYLAIRLGVLLGGVLFVLAASAIWQRVIFRYVNEPRRRRQLLLVKRVIVGLTLAVLLTLGFFSSLGSVATLLGFVTAGVALALQNVLLSAVAYFFLIGKYGLRVGDRVTVQGVTGEVIEVGFIRLFLMELAGAGTDLHPTGRLAVFANSVIFQPAAFMKQAPGMDYTWHAVTVTIQDPTDYQQIRARLTKAVSGVYQNYRQAIDQQHKIFEKSTDVQTDAPAPISQAQFAEKGLEVTIRYPVSLNEQPGHIDEQMVDCLVAEAQSEPKLIFAAGGSPKTSQVV